MIRFSSALVVVTALLAGGCSSSPRKVEPEVKINSVDTLPKEELFGAEIQYFRLRGGPGRNVPRAKVLELWARALDQAKAAKMNTIGFYIPWDFHEYAEGKFDFDGTADEDGDGQPDYPSRDLKTFLKMAEERGFKNIHVRPGPYINAEWGFLGFGAIPKWFHDKYPESHMHNPDGLRTKLFSYDSPELLRHTQLWFKKVYDEVLVGHLGPGKSISFLQIDNETNFLWQSIYNHDYGPTSVARYQAFLQGRYQELAKLNLQHKREWKTWAEIQPPARAGLNVGEDQDWYRFEDQTIFEYLKKVRAMWEALGVHEPAVHFTLADSYNAAHHGLLPNYRLHNDPAIGLLSVNLYPKTDETKLHPILNNPFKSDHDTVAQDAASEYYWGNGLRWMMGPETQAGWWKGTAVPPEARQQTYLSVIGHGMKGMYLYYFHEGDNWQSGWAREQVEPLYKKLHATVKYKNLSDKKLPMAFWSELQDQVNHQVMVGFRVKNVMHEDPKALEKLYFDAPLDGEAKPRPHFAMVQAVGAKVIEPHREWLRQSTSLSDPVCLVKDVAAHVPSFEPSLDNIKVNADWSAGLVGYALNSGVTLEILHWGVNPPERFNHCRLLLHQDNGESSPELVAYLKSRVESGMTVINFLGDSLPRAWGFDMKAVAARPPAPPFEPSDLDFENIPASQIHVPTTTPHRMEFGKAKFAAVESPFFHYTLDAQKCTSILTAENKQTAGYKCALGKGQFYQIGALFWDVFNSDLYATTKDIVPRTEFLRSVMHELNLVPAVQIREALPRVVAFGRQVAGQKMRWVTVKNGSDQTATFHVQLQELVPTIKYHVHDLLGDSIETLDGKTISEQGFAAKLGRYGSTVFWLEPTAQVSLR